MRGLYIFLMIGLLFISACSHNTNTGGCTKETQICPDGSTVGRNPLLNCEFDPCPGTIDNTNTDSDTLGDTENDDESPTPSIKEFSMTAKKWEFNPSTITVNKGDTVKLHINSIDVEHGFSLVAFDINENLMPGNIVDIEFVADKTGTFTFACSVYCGSGHGGMKGTLVVN